jgi:hypothetical protein
MGNHHFDKKTDCLLNPMGGLTFVKEQILDRLERKRKKNIDCYAGTALRFPVIKFAHR